MDALGGALLGRTDDVAVRSAARVDDDRLLFIIVGKDLRVDRGALVAGASIGLVAPCGFEPI